MIEAAVLPPTKPPEAPRPEAASKPGLPESWSQKTRGLWEALKKKIPFLRREAETQPDEVVEELSKADEKRPVFDSSDRDDSVDGALIVEHHEEVIVASETGDSGKSEIEQRDSFSGEIDEGNGPFEQVIDRGEIRTTTPDALIYSPEETERRIEELREFIANDEYVGRLRDRFLEERGYPTENVGGEQYVRLYRGLAPDWEEATTAAGLCKRGRGTSLAIRHQDEMEIIIERYRKGQYSGEFVLKRYLEQHMIDSVRSVFVPASTSEEYVRGVHPETGTIAY